MLWPVFTRVTFFVVINGVLQCNRSSWWMLEDHLSHMDSNSLNEARTEIRFNRFWSTLTTTDVQTPDTPG